jgi:hypothetical protein
MRDRKGDNMTTTEWEPRRYFEQVDFEQVGDTGHVLICTTETAQEGTTHAVMLDNQKLPEGAALDIAEELQGAAFEVMDRNAAIFRQHHAK